MPSSPRALTQAESDRVRAQMRALANKEGSQARAAVAIGASQQIFNRIMNGEAAGLYVARKLASHLGMTLEELFLPPSNLDRVVSSSKRPLLPQAIAAIRVTPGIETMKDRDLRELLERADEALRPIVSRAR